MSTRGEGFSAVNSTIKFEHRGDAELIRFEFRHSVTANVLGMDQRQACVPQGTETCMSVICLDGKLVGYEKLHPSS